MRRSFLFSFLIGFCGGICLAELWAAPVAMVGSALAISCVCLSWRGTRLPALILLGLGFGVWRWQTMTAVPVSGLATHIGQHMTLTGDIVGLPDDSDQQVVVLRGLRRGNEQLTGRLQASLPPFPEYLGGQQLTVSCQLEAFSARAKWRQWSHGIQGRCFNAVVMASTSGPPSLRRWLTNTEASVVDFIRYNFNEPQASLLSGIILGNQTGMPAELVRAFQATGTTHIIALSGFNVTIIVNSVMVVLVRVVGRRWAWIPGLLIVLLFVVMTGASASVVRAAVMAVIGQVGMFFGRPIHPARLLSYTALIMLLQNPLILLHDLGFQLSFLATIGLVFMSKPLAQQLPFIPEIFGLRDNLATTLAAIITTEPLLLWQFGRLSLTASFVNILVLPLIPLAMGLGTLCLVGLMIPVLATPVIAVTDAVLRIVLGVITTAAAWPWSLVYLPFALTAASGLVFVALAAALLRHTHASENFPA